ncbi:MAG: 50S ribosomal protein L11 methyltransferase, partial [Defluviitaleaceae bacterium]|nr:50S ribosomal protein L11 methyltransferase [Defluviitaleaceae bacterium]
VLANIVADVIIGITPMVHKYMKRDGLFIASGIIDERIEDVRQTIESNGFEIKAERQLDGWYCVVAGLKYA